MLNISLGRFLNLSLFIVGASLACLNCDPKIQSVAPTEIDPVEHQITWEGWLHSYPAWSPDGQRLALSREVHNTNLIAFSVTRNRLGVMARIKRDEIGPMDALSHFKRRRRPSGNSSGHEGDQELAGGF